jgi:hypothetical protein
LSTPTITPQVASDGITTIYAIDPTNLAGGWIIVTTQGAWECNAAEAWDNFQAHGGTPQ